MAHTLLLDRQSRRYSRISPFKVTPIIINVCSVVRELDFISGLSFRRIASADAGAAVAAAERARRKSFASRARGRGPNTDKYLLLSFLAAHAPSFVVISLRLTMRTDSESMQNARPHTHRTLSPPSEHDKQIFILMMLINHIERSATEPNESRSTRNILYYSVICSFSAFGFVFISFFFRPNVLR